LFSRGNVNDRVECTVIIVFVICSSDVIVVLKIIKISSTYVIINCSFCFKYVF
jgi:hypothetical protein